jgi:hypothetical protein
MTKLTVVYHNFVNAPYKNTIHTGATAFNAWQSPPKLWGNKGNKVPHNTFSFTEHNTYCYWHCSLPSASTIDVYKIYRLCNILGFCSMVCLGYLSSGVWHQFWMSGSQCCDKGNVIK